MAQEIEIAHKLKQCRDAAKKLHGDDYHENLKPHKALIETVMYNNDLEEIPALLKISETNTYQDNTVLQMMLMAATAELIEAKEDNKIFVQCIDNYNTPDPGALIKGKVYLVTEEFEKDWAVVDENGNDTCYSKKRFVIYNKDINTLTP